MGKEKHFRGIPSAPRGRLPQCLARAVATGLAVVSLGLVLCFGAVAQGTGQQETTYDIPALPLSEAIARFAEASDVDILSDRTLTDGRQSSPLIGRFTPQIGIEILLRDSGLASRFLRPKTAVIFQMAGQEAATQHNGFLKGPALDLDPVRVEASPLIGTGLSARFLDYGRSAQEQILSWLKSDSVLGEAHFQIKIDLTLDKDGSVAQSSFVQGSGDPSIDQRILVVIRRLQLNTPPPVGLPEPMRFMILAK